VHGRELSLIQLRAGQAVEESSSHKGSAEEGKVYCAKYLREAELSGYEGNEWTPVSLILR
jgi:hypothetical protein